MKKYFWFIIMAPVMVYGQSIVVTGAQQIDLGESTYFSFPKFSSDGTSLFMTGENYRGLWQYNLETNMLVNINKYDGSGYEPQIYNDKIVFRTQEYINGRKYTDLKMFDLNTRQESTLTDKKRHLNSVNILKNGTVCYTVEGVVSKEVLAKNLQKSDNENDTEPYIICDNAELKLARNDEVKRLEPVGPGNYIWCSLSPDQTKILFTVTGRGTYISDLEGNVISELGYANAPQWSPDGKWIVYMDDKDDGHKYISSDVFVSSFDGALRFKLTDSEHIALYPSWSPTGNYLAYHSDAGQIFLLNIELRP